MMDMSPTIEPKSDQLNADSLLAGPITIKIRKMEVRGEGEQRVSVYYDGDNGKPYKPGKSMARVMVNAWGKDANNYVGRSMILYNDPTVKWGGMEVGGIRISHMSDINGPMIMALTATRGFKKAYTVESLAIKGAEKKPEHTAEQKADAAKKKAETIIAMIGKTHDSEELTEVLDANSASIARIKDVYPDLRGLIMDSINLRMEFFDAEIGNLSTDNEELPL